MVEEKSLYTVMSEKNLKWLEEDSSHTVFVFHLMEAFGSCSNCVGIFQ